MTTTRNRRSRSSTPVAKRRSRADRARPHPGHGAAGGETADDPSARAGLRGWSWSDGKLEELSSLDEVEAAYRRPNASVWIDVESPTAELLGELGRCVGLHPLTVEDIVERNQRAKIESQTGETLHLVMFALLYDEELHDVEVDLVLGRRFLLSARGPEWDPLESQHFREGVERYLREGPDYALYAVVDYLVDGYFPVFDRLADEIDALQDEVLGGADTQLVSRLLAFRRDLLTIRHAVSPQRDIFNQLTTRDMGLVKEERIIYFRDVYDHLIRLTDELDSFRELVTGTLDAYLTTVNNNLSEVMKRLTAATVILAGMGAVAGIFGMSEAGLALKFAEAPGFWTVTLFVVALAIAGLFYFRRIGWL